MSIEIILIIALAVSVILLSVFLLIRIRNEKRLLGKMGEMNLPEFSDFLRINSSVGNIQAVAGKVSDLSRKSEQCSTDRICRPTIDFSNPESRPFGPECHRWAQARSGHHRDG